MTGCYFEPKIMASMEVCAAYIIIITRKEKIGGKFWITFQSGIAKWTYCKKCI
jgi:hypothetical protein